MVDLVILNLYPTLFLSLLPSSVLHRLAYRVQALCIYRLAQRNRFV